MIKNYTCNNCGKNGHLFHQCKLPITSFGIIVFRKNIIHNKEIIEYLMIRRKNSFGYIDFLRGKYNINNIEHIQSLINEMSFFEKELLLNNDFITLWKLLWNIKSDNIKNIIYKNEEINAQKKFEILKDGFIINNNFINLNKLIDECSSKYNETEWEFPKGRKNNDENDIDCALREFEEETGYSRKDITIINNLFPFEEIFIGSNHKCYKHKYYLAYMKEINNNIYNFQKSEVSKLEWKNINQCLSSIRPYNLEKKRLINIINKILTNYKIF